jgi:hypothetical protein
MRKHVRLKIHEFGTPNGRMRLTKYVSLAVSEFHSQTAGWQAKNACLKGWLASKKTDAVSK